MKIKNWAEALMLACIGCGSLDWQESTYATVEDARAAHLFEHGWMPDVLPPRAGPIKEAHNIDTSAHCSMSSFEAGVRPIVLDRLRLVEFSEVAIESTFRSPSPYCPFSLETIASAAGEPLRLRSRATRDVAVLFEGILYVWSETSAPSNQTMHPSTGNVAAVPGVDRPSATPSVSPCESPAVPGCA